MERLFSEAEGRDGGDERGTFIDTFVPLCGGHLQLGEVDGREWLLSVDGKGQPLTVDGVALSDGDCSSGLCSAAVRETGHEQGSTVNLQTLSSAELYLKVVKDTTPRPPHRGADHQPRRAMTWYLVFWRNRSTAMVVASASANQARSLSHRKQKRGYGAILAARRANPKTPR